MSIPWIALTLALMSAVVSSPRALAQQPVPVGVQFQVNTYTTLEQDVVAVAADSAGNFVMVWESDGSAGSDTSEQSIQAQRYDSAGTPQGGEFQVNTYTTGGQRRPAVATDGAGNFVVVWGSLGGAGSDADAYSIQARLFDSTGTPRGGQFQVNAFTTDSQKLPAVAADGTGSFVVVWVSNGSFESDTSAESVQGRLFNGDGNPKEEQFQVNTYTTGSQYAPAVAADAAGNFVVVWQSNGSAESDTSLFSIQGRRYDTAGTPQSSEFQVNTYTTGSQYAPAVAADAAGNFVVVWASGGSTGSDTSATSIQGRRYDSAGNPEEEEFQVNTYTTGAQGSPAVARESAGDFVVVWASNGSAGSDTDAYSVQGRRYDGAGTSQGGEFQVNTYTTDYQGLPAVSTDGAGSFVVAWESRGSAGSDTSELSAQGQRFAVPTTSTTSTTLPTTDLLPGRIVVIRRGTLAKFVAKPVAGDRFTLPASDPAALGGSLRLFDLATTAGDDTYSLPAGTGWKGLGKPAGSKGYKYTGAGTAGDPCEVVLVKPSVMKGVCRGAGITLTPPFTGDVGVDLSLGTTDRYCAQFGGKSVKNTTSLTKRKKAPAPGSCPP